jgi:hypothetical protein
MWRSSLWTGVLALCLSACATLPAPEGAIRALEQEQVRAALAGDRAALERIFAADFRLINPSGAVATRDDLLRLLASGAPPYRTAVYVTETMRSYDRVVVTTGTENVEFGQGVQAGTRQQRRITQVWERAGKGWQLVLRQATLVAPPP